MEWFLVLPWLVLLALGMFVIRAMGDKAPPPWGRFVALFILTEIMTFLTNPVVWRFSAGWCFVVGIIAYWALMLVSLILVGILFPSKPKELDVGGYEGDGSWPPD